MIGLLVNPRDGEPYYAEKIKDKYRTIRICSLEDSDDGSGYFNHDDESYAGSSHITGLPRVHTPDGVKSRGKGLGTVLYTSLCLAAHLEYEGVLRLDGIDVSGDGISSNQERSQYASAWWGRAYSDYGLTERMEGCAEEEFDESDIGAGRHESDIEQIVADALHTDKVSLSSWTLSASGTKEACGLEADAYPYKNALKSNLIVATVEDKGLVKDVYDWASVEGSDFEEIHKKPLAALNTGVLRSFDKKIDQDNAIKGILAIGRHVGLSQRDLEGLYIRFLAGADEDPSTWKYPNFESYDPTVRENPRRTARKIRIRLQGGRQITVPIIQHAGSRLRHKRVPKAQTKFYGRVRQNPADPKLVKEIERLHELRAELGWSTFAAGKTAP